jgi:hypothetical protein
VRLTWRAPVAAALATAVVVACGPADGGAPAEPWPQRPTVGLKVDVADDLSTVTGRETVAFTPDLRVCGLVFRLWPNKPTAVRDGTAMQLTDATVDGAPVTPVVQAAGAPEGAPGTLAELPLPGCVEAGETVRGELGFSLRLGEGSDERVGYSRDSGLAWFATAFPLLAWERGHGWARDPAVDMFGETVTSEAFRVDALEVTASSAHRVLASGSPAGTSPGARPGATTHRFTADALRDLAVAVGRFQEEERDVRGVRLHVGTPVTGSRLDAGEWADALADQLGRLETFLGPYPYRDLWAVVLPPLDDGVEFPTSLQFGDVGHGEAPSLIAHELAHQWFYALVGNNQARDPWIDEAFATYAQARAAGQEELYSLGDVDGRTAGELGRPMAYWARGDGFGPYVRGVYDQGAAVLLEARRRAGEDRFDAALRAYLTVDAHRVVRPGDVEAAFHDLPEVLALLREHGALPS